MTKTVYLLACDKGYLKDIEVYTHDVLDAVTFSSFETATERLAKIGKLLSNECYVTTGSIPFPRPVAARPLSKTFN